jgi:type III restriction enzyme
MMLPLVRALTPRVQAECAGLETGSAPILEKVTPVTADLLRWWFQQDCVDARAVNFHGGQRQAILHTIYAHEVLQAETLKDLYLLLSDESWLGLAKYEALSRSAHPKYCLKMATGTGKTWVLQALAWCERLNELPEEQRSGRTWSYCLLGEALFYEFRSKGATMEDILQFSRARAKAAGKESLFG